MTTRSLCAKQLAIPLLVLMLQGCNACGNETNIVAPAPHDETEVFDHNWGRYLSLSAMPDGTPALSYYDQTKTGLGFALGTLSEEDGVSWEWSHEEVDGYADETGLDTGDRGLFTSMEVAADGTAWVGYRDETNGSLRYANRSANGTWTTGVVDAGNGISSPNVGHWTSLALDSSGYPVIAHHDAAEGQLRVSRYLGSAFSSEVVDDGEPTESEAADSGQTEAPEEANVGQFAKLIIVGGVEYIAYYDASAGALKLAYGTSEAYQIETVDDDGNVGQWPDITVIDGLIHISYQDVDDNDLMYAVGEPGFWTIERIDSGDYSGADSEIFAYEDTIAIAYQDGYENNVNFAVMTDSGWEIENLTEAPGAYGFYNEVLVLEEDTYVACYQLPGESVWFQTLD